MLTDKKSVAVLETPFGTEELPELNGCDYLALWNNKNVLDVIYRLASEKRQLKFGDTGDKIKIGVLLNERRSLNDKNEELKEENKQLVKNLNEVWNERNELYEENKRLIEEYKLLESYYKSVRNQRDELIDDNIAMKEQNEQLIADNNLYYEELVKVKNIVCEAHSTIDINFNVRFVDGC